MITLFEDTLVIIKGGGDLASGVAYRLKRSGFPVMMTELPQPLLVRRTVCFGEAIYSGQTTVEQITARRVNTSAEARRLAAGPEIPILIDPEASVVAALQPAVLIDGIMAKRNTGTRLTDAPLVVALGPGFTAGQDCHAIIETKRGHWLGRVIEQGSAEPNTGKPGVVKGFTADRVLRAPTAGQVDPLVALGDRVEQNQLLARVGDQALRAPFPGVLRGLIHPSVPVTPGLKIGDLDPRADRRHCFTISDKALAIGGGVLEAILASRTRYSA